MKMVQVCQKDPHKLMCFSTGLPFIVGFKNMGVDPSVASEVYYTAWTLVFDDIRAMLPENVRRRR